MKFDLSASVFNIEGVVLTRQAFNKELYSDAPLTLAFVVSHLLSSSVEDLNAYEQAANSLKAAQLAGQPLPPGTRDSDELRAEAATKKTERGNLALRIMKDQENEVELSAAEVGLILDLASPRLMPLILAQLKRVIN